MRSINKAIDNQQKKQKQTTVTTSVDLNSLLAVLQLLHVIHHVRACMCMGAGGGLSCGTRAQTCACKKTETGARWWRKTRQMVSTKDHKITIALRWPRSKQLCASRMRALHLRVWCPTRTRSYGTPSYCSLSRNRRTYGMSGGDLELLENVVE